MYRKSPCGVYMSTYECLFYACLFHSGRSVPIVVVANKCEREIPLEKRIIADCVVTIDYECKHIETSARQGQGLKDVFSILLGYFGPYLAPSSGENECKKKQSIWKRLTGMFRRLIH